MAADWSDAFDRLEAAVSVPGTPESIVYPSQLAIVAGREASHRAEELGAENAVLRSIMRCREKQEASPPRMPGVSLLRYGDEVLLGPDRIRGCVIGAMVGAEGYVVVRYLVAWWDAQQMRQEWVDSILVDAADDTAPRAHLSYGGVSNA